jgi:hypothetical protein
MMHRACAGSERFSSIRSVRLISSCLTAPAAISTVTRSAADARVIIRLPGLVYSLSVRRVTLFRRERLKKRAAFCRILKTVLLR